MTQCGVSPAKQTYSTEHGMPLPFSSALPQGPVSVLVPRYKLAVTRRKEEEPTSTSVYNQNDPWTPTVAFADYINNETITNEDLVAWITAGFLHIPHSEDIPNTLTVGNSVGFLLRPYNYYDLDPSIYSPDGVKARRKCSSSVVATNAV
uniref:Amine oxidase n=1 Tax=Meleagris gallopavo TaxID=9103 RepID=A0A803XM23_MELGA